MATRAEKFKADAQRRAQAGKPHGKKRRGRGSQAARAALVARDSGDATVVIPHNTAPRRFHKSEYELEASRSGRPSRKSTRRSPAHIKAGTSLRVRRPGTHS